MVQRNTLTLRAQRQWRVTAEGVGRLRALKNLPAWALEKKQAYRSAPQWVRMLGTGQGFTNYARRGTGASLEIIVWNSRKICKIQNSDRR